jgi:hypothetical protein
LVSAVEKILIKFEKRLPSADIRKFVVTRAVAEDPERALGRLLEDPAHPEMLEKFDTLLSKEKAVLKESIVGREAEFKKRYGIVFREGRIDLIVNRMIERGFDVNTVSEEVVEVQRKVEEFERDFQRRTGIDLQFSEEAIHRVTEIILEEEGKGTALFSKLSKDFEYGFELIRDKTGQKEFIVTKETVDDPEGYLNRLIREIYRRQSDQRVEDKE